MGFGDERGDGGKSDKYSKNIVTDEDVQPLEALASELHHLNDGIKELINRRDYVRSQITKRVAMISEEVAKADDHFYMATSGPNEGMPTEDRPEPRRPNFG